MKKLLLISFLIFIFKILQSQIPANYLTDFSKSGLYSEINNEHNIINIIDFGALPDDNLDDNTAFIEALNYLSETGGTLIFPAGIFNFTQSFQIPSNISILGESCDETILSFNNAGNGNLINIYGTQNNNCIHVTQAIKNTNFLICNQSSEFQEGNIIKLKMDGNDYMFSDWATSDMGQILIITEIKEDTIFLDNFIRHNFYVDKNACITKINPATNIKISNLKILRIDQTNYQTSNINLSNAFNCEISAIESEKCNFAHVSISNSKNIKISGSYFHHAFAYGEGGQGYGTEIEASSSDCLIENNIFNNLRHSILLQSGANGNVIAYNYSINPYWQQGLLPSGSAGDLVLHGNYPYCNLFEGNIAQNAVIDDSHGKNGPYNVFYRNRLEKYGIVMNFNPPTDSTVFVGNEITNTQWLLGNFTIMGNGNFLHGNNVKGNCNPANTTNISTSSYFLSSSPCYFDNLQWPAIGYPNALNQFSIPAKNRFSYSDYCFVECENIPSFISNHSSQDVYKILQADNHSFNIHPDCINCQISIYDVYGRKIMSQYSENSTIKVDLLNNSLYLIKIITNTNKSFVNKIMITR
ncbi:MAG TPA: glycosyl hydrolase family 28-related protein [Bacteroidales bacterium]|nr:glycosyl hydrolase family 28-related protein [Bacteroidales bacterium]HPD23054.1 glycosyl hydrolase family 28-related protein [Bacteroidales bacterium]HRS99342.1 glycosyl hydrolase family 28-related protein [Bacteroidales bacterium]HRT79844.1 glycosyl hydrolase family 28-related protein [Bacteroidales bacterium]